MILTGCGSGGGSSSPPASLTISASSLPAASQGVLYSEFLTATGGTPPYTWSVIAGSLPPGITLSSTGELLGVATSGGSFTFTVQVVDSSQSAQAVKISQRGE